MERFSNNIIFGIISATILPVIIFILLYYSKFSSLDILIFPKRMLMGNLLPLVFSWCILPNLLLFFIFSWVNYLKSAKGVLIATVVLTIMLFGMKIIYH